MLTAIVIALSLCLISLAISCGYIAHQAITIISELSKQQTEQTQHSVVDLTSVVESVGKSIANSMSAAFAPPPVDTQTNSTTQSGPGSQPLSPFYGDPNSLDDSDPTDSDRYLGLDVMARAVNQVFEYDDSDPTGLGLSRDPANFGGK